MSLLRFGYRGVFYKLNDWGSSEYYDAFVSIQRGLFNTRDRAEHTRKRKTVSHTFSTKSIGQFEQYMEYNLRELVKQWDRLADGGRGGWMEMDCLHWFNYLAFDIIGDLVRTIFFDRYGCRNRADCMMGRRSVHPLECS